MTSHSAICLVECTRTSEWKLKFAFCGSVLPCKKILSFVGSCLEKPLDGFSINVAKLGWFCTGLQIFVAELVHTCAYGGIVRNVERDRRELDTIVSVRHSLFMRHGWFANGHAYTGGNGWNALCLYAYRTWKMLEVLYGNHVGLVTQLEVPSGEIVQLPLRWPVNSPLDTNVVVMSSLRCCLVMKRKEVWHHWFSFEAHSRHMRTTHNHKV